MVSFGAGPAPISEEIIAMIKSNIMEDGFVKTYQDISPGDKVIIKEGPLKDFVGIFERGMKDSDRVRLLLHTVSYQAHIERERESSENRQIGIVLG